MRAMIALSSAFVLCLPWSLYAGGKGTQPYQAIDQHALDAPKEAEQSFVKLAAYLQKQAKSDPDKARAAFRWVADRIAYNADVFFSGKGSTLDTSAETALRTRTTTCDGYANAYGRLCLQMGLQAVKIQGHSKGYGYTTGERVSRNHSWNAVKVDGGWQLVDPTWGSGYVQAGKGFTKNFEDFYFFTPPDQFIFEHLPEDPKWQLLKKPVSATAYQRWPRVELELFQAGVTVTDIETVSAKKGFKGLVQSFRNLGQGIRIVKAPLEGHLIVGEKYDFHLRAPEGAKLALIANKKDWTHLKEADGVWEAAVTPVKGELHVVVRWSGKEERFWSVLQYVVE